MEPDTGQTPKEEALSEIIAFIILGALAGAIAKALLPGERPWRVIVTDDHRDVAESAARRLLSPQRSSTPHPLDEFFDISTWLTAIVGSIVLLLIPPRR